MAKEYLLGNIKGIKGDPGKEGEDGRTIRSDSAVVGFTEDCDFVIPSPATPNDVFVTIWQAIDKLRGAGGGKLVFREGVYDCGSRALEIDFDAIVEGMGKSTVIKNGSFVVYSSATIRDIDFETFGISYNGDGSENRLFVSNISFNNCRNAILLAPNSRVMTRDCSFIDCTRAIDNVSSGEIENCYFKGGSEESIFKYLPSGTGNSNIRIIGNTFDNASVGFLAYGSNSKTDRVTISENNFIDCSQPFNLKGLYAPSIHSNHIFSSLSAESTAMLENCTLPKFIGNTLLGIPSIYLASSSPTVSIGNTHNNLPINIE